jgi:hypothetical protein
MKNLLTILIALVVATGTINSQSQQYKVQVNDFTRLKVAGSVNVDYRQSADSAGYAVFTAPAEQVSMMVFTPKKEQLTVDFSPLEGYSTPTGLPTITVYSNGLTSIENNGDSLVRVMKLAPVAELKAKVSGNGTLSLHDIKATKLSATLQLGYGNIVITGEAPYADFALIGTGSIQALGLTTTTVKCTMAGTGYIECAPAQDLTIKGAGSGKVYYNGNPLINDKWMLGGKIIKLDQANQ